MPDVASSSWPRKPVGPAKHLLAEVVLDLFELGGPDVSRDIAIARLGRAAAEASAKRTLDYHTPTKFFGQWWQAIERPMAQPKSRGSPRAHAPPSTTTDPVISPEERAAVRAEYARYMESRL